MSIGVGCIARGAVEQGGSLCVGVRRRSLFAEMKFDGKIDDDHAKEEDDADEIDNDFDGLPACDGTSEDAAKLISDLRFKVGHGVNLKKSGEDDDLQREGECPSQEMGNGGRWLLVNHGNEDDDVGEARSDDVDLEG